MHAGRTLLMLSMEADGELSISCYGQTKRLKLAPGQPLDEPTLCREFSLPPSSILQLTASDTDELVDIAKVVPGMSLSLVVRRGNRRRPDNTTGLRPKTTLAVSEQSLAAAAAAAAADAKPTAAARHSSALDKENLVAFGEALLAAEGNSPRRSTSSEYRRALDALVAEAASGADANGGELVPAPVRRRVSKSVVGSRELEMALASFAADPSSLTRRWSGSELGAGRHNESISTVANVLLHQDAVPGSDDNARISLENLVAEALMSESPPRSSPTPTSSGADDPGVQAEYLVGCFCCWW